MVTSLLAMQERHANQQATDADDFDSVMPMLRAAIAALRGVSSTSSGPAGSRGPPG